MIHQVTLTAVDHADGLEPRALAVGIADEVNIFVGQKDAEVLRTTASDTDPPIVRRSTGRLPHQAREPTRAEPAARRLPGRRRIILAFPTLWGRIVINIGVDKALC